MLKLYYEADLVLLFQQNRWIEMFPCIIARTSTNEVISNGINGTRNGALQLVSKICYVFTVLLNSNYRVAVFKQTAISRDP